MSTQRAASAHAETCAVQRFERRGDYWLVGYRGIEAYVRDLKGMSYLATLLAHPRQLIPVLDLMQGSAPACNLRLQHAGTDCSVTTTLEGYEAQLDGVALSCYRRRLRELASDLDAAELDQDLARKQVLSLELEALEHQLRSAAKARSRPSERARKAVYNCIRKAIASLDRLHPYLARHLIVAVRTGAYCQYAPETEHQWVTSA